VRLIDPDPEQSRKVFDEVSLQELAQAMSTNELAVPILLRPAPEARSIIVHGERCWRAAQR
jgi:ParB family transcriptional regulator, chromosome partitioning protein